MKSFTRTIPILCSLVAATAGCAGDLDEELGTEALEQRQGAFTAVRPGTRPDIHSLTASQRTTLVNAMLAFITQPILDEHANAHDWHHPAVGELFFSRHHDYLNKLEDYLLDNGFSQFVPVPLWDPATSIPAEFRVADPLVSQTPMNANPNRPLPSQFNNLCSFATASDLAVQIETWHDGVHGAVGGPMGSINQAPGAPIFWLWHGFLDDKYHEYEWACEQTSQAWEVANRPGALCKASGTHTLTYTTGAEAQNASSSATMTAVCPANRVTMNGSFSNLVYGRVWVTDQHPTANVCCRIESRNPGSGSVVSSDSVCSSGSSGSSQSLNVDFPKVHDPYTFSHYQLNCTVPPTSGGNRSAVRTYRIYQYQKL